MVPESHLVDELKKVVWILEELVGISKYQQELFSGKDWNGLVETFQRREKLVTEVHNMWKEINDSSNASLDRQKEIDNIKATARELIEEFQKTDQHIQTLINYQMENIVIELCKRRNVQIVVERYKEADRITGVVSRTFKNGARYFDENY